MNNWDRFNDTELPKQEYFYSKLYDAHIRNDAYERAKHVWERFKITDMGEYHDLYLRTYVLLLIDIFENFRNLCMNYILWVRSCILSDIIKICLGCYVEKD